MAEQGALLIALERAVRRHLARADVRTGMGRGQVLVVGGASWGGAVAAVLLQVGSRMEEMQHMDRANALYGLRTQEHASQAIHAM